jgi:hypothetical protein
MVWKQFNGDLIREVAAEQLVGKEKRGDFVGEK